MLEGLAAWVLNTYVGEYVENLNTHQLSIGLLRGQVELENLPLKKDAFRQLLLPFEIKAGFIGKISLTIPVTRLRSEPWVINVERLYVVVGPVSLNEYDEDHEEQVLQNAKLSKLDAMEAKWKADNESKQEPSYYAYSYASWLTYGTSVMTNIVKNLQLKIKDVHLRYEDSYTDPQHPFACGLTIQSLSSLGDNIKEMQEGSSKDMTCQSLQLNGCAVYCDSDATLLGGLNIMDMAAAMQSHQNCYATTSGAIKPHSYLLSNITAQTQISRNCSEKPLRSRNKPRILCNLQVDKFALTLNEVQYKVMVLCARELERINVCWKFRKWRPSVPVTGNARHWWQFAVDSCTSHIRQRQKQTTWEFASCRAKQLKAYVDIYFTHLTKPESLTTENQKEKDHLEHQLNFETLLALRELVIQRVRKEQALWAPASHGQGLLRYWFPGWTGWTTASREASVQSSGTPDSCSSEADDDSFISSTLTSQIEEEILGVLESVNEDTFLKRDTVLARVNFSLGQCTLTLVGQPSIQTALSEQNGTMKPLMELRFADMKVDIETRPRLSSLLFELRLGAMYLQDCSTADTAYPYIISPHTVEPLFRPLQSMPTDTYKSSFLKFAPFSSSSGLPNIPLIPLEKFETSSTPLFELIYEKKPFGSIADHRLVVNTQSLDVVYSASTIRSIKQFFTLYNHCDMPFGYSASGLNLSAAARSKYEKFKQHTKEEIRHKWDLMLEGEHRVLETKRWDIHMDISAPQIIVPENFTEKLATVVLLDLGRLQFSNSAPRTVSCSSGKADGDDVSDDEEDFKTPCSSPPNEADITTNEAKTEDAALTSLKSCSIIGDTFVVTSSPPSSISEMNMRDHMYERYTLNLQDMQVLIGNSKDSWKFAQLRGTSPMHVMDRFSISIQMERRLVATDDPQWPSVTLSGKLPKLTVHVNEQKVQAVQMCITKLKESTSSHPRRRAHHVPPAPDEVLKDNVFRSDSSVESGAKEIHEHSLLLLMQFCIEKMSLEVQSRGRCIAELQVTGAQATFSKRPLDCSLTLCVHGLLLVDALQTYGPDFELLVASHKHVSMDSRSGSLRDSDPNSPTSPSSPPVHAHTPPLVQAVNIPNVLSAVLSTLHASPPKVLMDQQPSPMVESQDVDALITVEITIVNTPSADSTCSAEQEQMLLASVQFNNLDVIANQETIVELVSFVQCLQTKATPTHQVNVPSGYASSASLPQMADAFPAESAGTPRHLTSIELTFDFHHFNVLLLRAVNRKGSVSGQKVATATMSSAKIQASVGSSLKIHGTLGGLQVCDLTSDKTVHRRIMSVGDDPHVLLEAPNSLNKLHTDLYKQRVHGREDAGSQKALSFTVTRSGRGDGLDEPSETNSWESTEKLEVVVRMASVCYVHSPRLLQELASCAAEFKGCISALATSIKNAATEVALGIVTLPAQSVAASFHVSVSDGSPCSAADPGRDAPADDTPKFGGLLPLDVRLDILLQTPVIVLPCSTSSPDVLVAHLGRISVQNTNSSVLQSPNFILGSCDPFRADHFFVQFKDVNLYSLDIEENLKSVLQLGKTVHASPDFLSVAELYQCSTNGHLILHDTVIEFSVMYKRLMGVDNFGWFYESVPCEPEASLHPVVEITGTVINDLKVVLTKKQYQLMLLSLANLSHDDASEDGISEAVSHLAAHKEEPVYINTQPHGSSACSKSCDSRKPKFVCCRANFTLPAFLVHLCGDLCEAEQDLVMLSFQELSVHYEKDSPYETSIQVALRGLLMEDLLEVPDSDHRYLIRSSNLNTVEAAAAAPPRADFISVSCPDMTHHVPLVPNHPSLPDHLCTENVFKAHLKRNRPKDYPRRSSVLQRSNSATCPFTPPPSPSGRASPPAQEDSLMHLSVLLIDKRSPYFVSKHNQTHSMIQVNFNCLEVTINSQTWVMVLDFLGVSCEGPAVQKSVARRSNSMMLKEDPNAAHETLETRNTELDVSICNLTVTLNKPVYQLARSTISNFAMHTSFRDGNAAARASLEKISVLDLSPYGELYRERFVTTGKEALHFDIFRYGEPDPELKREFDIKVKCEMSSVQLVYTHRFILETMEFFADFTELQMLLANLRAATKGNEVNVAAGRAPRVKLEVTAGTPVIVVPQAYNSHDVLAANLGNLTVCTSFCFVGDEGTVSSLQKQHSCTASPTSPNGNDIRDVNLISLSDEEVDAPCLLQVMNITLVDMDLYSGTHISGKARRPSSGRASGLLFSSCHIEKNDGALLQQTFMLKLQAEKNLDSSTNHAVPDWTVQGSFSSVHFTIDRQQGQLIQGILRHNLGEQVEGSSPSSFSLVETPAERASLADRTWTTLAMYMDLVNVSLELVHSRPKLLCANVERSLAKVDLIKSRLSVEKYSDQTSDVDLVSHEIRVSDTRYRDAPANDRPNVFSSILQPTRHASEKKVLQVEFHYRVARNLARFTVLLNNMRVMAIFDWIKEVSDFLAFTSDLPSLPSAASMPQHSLRSQHDLPFKRDLPQNKECAQLPLELKLNLTDTEIVVVDNTAAWDTNAVILKSTAVLSYSKNLSERPLSCNLQNMEVFSCILGVEEDTALSIVDPVTVYIDVIEKSPQSAPAEHLLQVSTMNVNLRLSYNDMKLFMSILDSVPKQSGFKKDESKRVTLDARSASDVQTLQGMGFSYEDCLRGLQHSSGKVDEAALWLTQNATVLRSMSSGVNVRAVELKVSTFCLCIIDDCMDADVPLLEINLRETYITQQLLPCYGGESKFFFSTGYYNRSLSGWEPIIEPWRCHCHWKMLFEGHKLSKLNFKVEAEDTLNLNITTALLDLYHCVKQSWTADLYQLFSKEPLSDKETFSNGETSTRRRSPFIPFALKNDLGLKFSFATVVSSACSLKESAGDLQLKWTEINPGEVIPFTFQEHGKLRHQDSHKLRMHQVILTINGYQQLDPVSVDKVGVYFRYAAPKEQYLHSGMLARVVFSVTLDGSARKLVTVRSALLVRNKMDVAMELKLEMYGARPHQMCLQSNSTVPLPLAYVYSEIWARPAFSMTSYASLQWQQTVEPQAKGGYATTCTPFHSSGKVFRFSVGVKHNSCMDKRAIPKWWRVSDKVIPAHTITLLPPICIYNLLPYDLSYVFTDSPCKGVISPRKSCFLHEINTEQYVIITFSFENFRHCSNLVVPPGSGAFTTKLEARDAEGRLLILHVKVCILPGHALKLYVYADYWIINRSGLPLIFKQEGTSAEAAGQQPEHEQARSVAPLLFSFADPDESMMCSMRVGMQLHPNSFPQWCTGFPLEKAIRVRRLIVSPNDARPDWVYTIGVDVKQGRGIYSSTNYVVLSPRFLLDNRSSSIVEFAQRFATIEQYSHQHRCHISSAMPQCSLPFHWPRVDLDNLLCVRLVDVPGCLWSGGFRIDELNSFHVHMRDRSGKSYFLRVEVIQERATFFVVFADCTKIPPLIRIDNQSEVPITFHQTGVSEGLLRGVVQPHSAVPYAWDEPILNPYITVIAPGGMSETYDMTSFREGKHLYYENFFYIAFTGTFLEPRALVKLHPYSKDVKCQELVLDVPHGTCVVINKKELGKRSQLWRMTSTGMLQHEGSSTPLDPRSSAASGRNGGRMLVLDIAGLGPEPKQYTELMLRKPDERRRLTQTWTFTENGRLCCQLPNMFVQPRDGFVGLRRGNDVVLGPPQPVIFLEMENGIPLEQAISNQKMRGGSGILSVKVVPDGPTIVLCVTDFRQKQLVTKTSAATEWVVVEEKTNNGKELRPDVKPDRPCLDLQMHLIGGIGISVINHLNEELLYALLHNILVDVSQGPGSQSLDASIQDVHVDNQLRDAERPVALYVTPSHKKDQQRHLPAVRITAHRIPQRDTDAEIFKHFIMEIKNITLVLEELLVLKIAQLLYFDQSSHCKDSDEEIIDNQIQRAHAVASASAVRFYFSTLKLSLQQVKLSVLTMSQKPPELKAIKKMIGWSPIRFEDANVELDSFVKSHPFESLEFLTNSVIEHYKGELQSQAAKILGSVDFLGNPLGLFNDLSAGFREFISDGNTMSLIKSVTHGFSNSTAKITGSWSDGLKNVAMTKSQQEERTRTRLEDASTRTGPFITGLKGLGYGIRDGFTGIVKHSYQGASTEGVPGLITGIGKGILGALAMPTAGALDFVSGAASAVRNTSKLSSHNHPKRCRAPRLCSGPGGLLPCYSTTQALGQQFLCSLNDGVDDLYVAMEQLETVAESFRVLISTERVLLLLPDDMTAESIAHMVPYSKLKYCRSFPSSAKTGGSAFQIEFVLWADEQTSSLSLHDRTFRVGCDSEHVAQKVVQQINYAKLAYEERGFTAQVTDSDEDDA
uniref:Putative vacuolar protein n=1 Tax=Ornithodoros turicata TaxID=34597 RepID=A0A2R5LD33_9ACAR